MDPLLGVYTVEEISGFFEDEKKLDDVNYEMDDFLEEMHEQVNIVWEGMKVPILEEKLVVFQDTAKAMQNIDPGYSEELRGHCKQLKKEIAEAKPKEVTKKKKNKKK